jgi:hypothetical protein
MELGTLLVLGPIGLNDYKLAPGLCVVRLLTSPSKVRFGNVRSRPSVRDGLAIEADSTDQIAGPYHHKRRA